MKMVILDDNGNGEFNRAQSLFPVDLMSHDVVEIVAGHETVLIEIGLGEDVVDFVLAQLLSQLGCDFLELLHCDLSLG